MQTSTELVTALHQAQALSLVKAVILFVGGLIAARFTSATSQKIISKYASTQQTMILNKIIYFGILVLFTIAALQELGFRLSVLLGSAGILTAALAFASQTSISNIISGVFLIMEKSFKIGDSIKIGNTSGVIASIDLLSVKVLTPQNTLVRIPNETLIKSEIVNVTRFKTRRLDLILEVSDQENITHIKQALIELAKNNSLVLPEPAPSVVIQKIANLFVNLQLSVWVEQKHYDKLRDNLYQDIITYFHENNIEL